MKLIIDIETDGLLKACTTCWIITTIDADSEEVYQFLPFQGDTEWQTLLSNAESVIGHNILGFDLVALQKLYGFKLPRRVKVYDTLIMSQVLDYRRFSGDGHSLARWGEYLGHPKPEHEDWSQFSPEMRHRNEEDAKINLKIYNILKGEFSSLAAKAPNIKIYLRAEHWVSEFCASAELHGWPFDVESAKALEREMAEAMAVARDRISPLLGTKVVPRDQVTSDTPKWTKEGRYTGEVEVKSPKWLRSGLYDQSTSKWFGIDPCSGYPGEERMIEGEFCRVEFKPLDLDSVADVKFFLFRNGWQPTEYNIKKVLNEETGRVEPRRGSPKITEDSLAVMDGNGKLYCDFLTTKSRHGILSSWLEEVDESGRLHGECFTIGTPSMRARHKGIVNVPSADAAWGKQMRSLFGSIPGWTLVGCDSAGNQARGLAHYLQNEEFVNLLLHGDIHQYNADVLTAVLKEKLGIEHKVPRGVAKRVLYAFLFGASGAKLWSYVFGALDVTKGNKLKEGFLAAVPGFKTLIDKLEKIFKITSANGDGYIPSIAGNKVYVDSKHKLLVYLLQSCEKATCSAATMLTMQWLEEQGIPFIPCIMMHDEIDFLVPDEHAETARCLGIKAFQEGPKLYGITIMDGDGKIGRNWYEVH